MTCQTDREMLEPMRTLTGEYRVPDDACGTYRACLSLLETLERDTHIHIHKENNILFHRGVEAECQRSKEACESPKTEAGPGFLPVPASVFDLSHEATNGPGQTRTVDLTVISGAL